MGAVERSSHRTLQPMVGDPMILYIEGSRGKLDGKIQERYGDRREEVKKWIDEWFEQNKTSEHVKP